jgi:hypothetical protein
MGRFDCTSQKPIFTLRVFADKKLSKQYCCTFPLFLDLSQPCKYTTNTFMSKQQCKLSIHCVDFCVLTPISAIFQLYYHGDQF